MNFDGCLSILQLDYHPTVYILDRIYNIFFFELKKKVSKSQSIINNQKITERKSYLASLKSLCSQTGERVMLI